MTKEELHDLVRYAKSTEEPGMMMLTVVLARQFGMSEEDIEKYTMREEKDEQE